MAIYLREPAIVAILQRSSSATSCLVSDVDDILQELADANLSYRMKLPPRTVGVQPANRDGLGVSEADVHSLGAEIVTLGFSHNACKDAICVEDGPANAIELFTTALCADSKLAAVVPGTVRYGSLSCSHTNQFLCAVLAGVPSDEDVLSQEGHMSYSKLATKDPILRQAMTEGMEWLVLKAAVETMYPTLPALIQSARNATTQVQREESEIQILFKIGRLSAQLAKRSGGNVDWQQVLSAASKSRPKCMENIPSIISYCQKFGGESLLADLTLFFQFHVSSNRVIASYTFSALGGLKLNPEHMLPLVATAVLKAQATCPTNKVVQQQCRYITQGEIASLTTNRKEQAHVAENLLRECRLLAYPHKIDAKPWCRLAGKLDCRMIRHLLGKTDSAVVYAQSSDIAHTFVVELNEILQESEKPLQHNPFPTPAVLQSAKSAIRISVALPNIIDYDGDDAKNAKQLSLLHAGFSVGAKIAKENNEQPGIISAMHDNGDVSYILDGALAIARIAYIDFAGAYGLATKSSAESITDWPSKNAKRNAEFAIQTAKGQVAVALAELHAAIETPRVTIATKPKRAVMTNICYKKNKLIIVPATTRIVFVKADAPPPSGAVRCNMEGLDEGFVYLLPLSTVSFVEPAWHIATTAERDKANIEVQFAKCTTVFAAARQRTSISKDAEHSLDVPIFVNNRDLEQGEELLMYRAVADKTKHVHVLDLSPRHDMKKQKTC